MAKSEEATNRRLSNGQIKGLLKAWLWFGVFRFFFFLAFWGYAEWVMDVQEPPLILALSFGAMLESALAVIVATYVALRQEEES